MLHRAVELAANWPTLKPTPLRRMLAEVVSLVMV
jgi:hypothetical protein